MIRARRKAETRLAERDLAPGEGFLPDEIWIDLLRPSEAERAYVSDALGLDLPNFEEMQEIEASSRLYTEDGAIYMTAPIPARTDMPNPEMRAVTFVLTRNRLVTLRHSEPRSFDAFAARLPKQPGLIATPEETLVSLLETIVDRLADVLERIGADLDALSRRVFGRVDGRGGARQAAQQTLDLEEVLQSVGAAGDLAAKVRISLAGLERMLAFVHLTFDGRGTPDQRARLKTLSRDLRSIVEHAGFLSSQVAFLLDATLGLINIAQTNIVKIFSVAAVAFLPPTLIASIYGMNFRHMPELGQPWGYPLALVAMILSALLPLWYFRRKGWL